MMDDADATSGVVQKAGKKARPTTFRAALGTVYHRLKGYAFRRGKRGNRSSLALLPEISLRHTGTAKGRAAFALRSFRCGETVEICPVIVTTGKFRDLPDELKDFVFNWRTLAGARAGSLAMALGYGSMYNHDSPANMTYEALPKKFALRFRAARDIAAGEELTINYSGGVAEDDRWFSRRGISPIGTARQKASPDDGD